MIRFPYALMVLLQQLVERLRQVDVNGLTPLAALTLLADLKRDAEE